MDLQNGARREVMKRYLFQEMSDAEREEIEGQFFQDETYFYELADLENELLDSYARGDMGDEEKARFERSLLLLPERRERLVQAVALQRLVAAEKKSPPPLVHDEPPEVIIGRRPSRHWTLAGILPSPSPAFACALAVLLIATNVALALAYFGEQRTTARAREDYSEQLRRMNAELDKANAELNEANAKLDEAKRRSAEQSNKEPDGAGAKYAAAAVAKRYYDTTKRAKGITSSHRPARNTPATAPTPRASRIDHNLTEALARRRAVPDEELPEVVGRPRDWLGQIGYRNSANEEAADLFRRVSSRGFQVLYVPYLENELNKLRNENDELKGRIPEVVRAPEEYQAEAEFRGETPSSSAKPTAPIKIGPRTTSVELTLKLPGEGLSAEDVRNIRFGLTNGGPDRPVVPLEKSLSKRRLLVVNLPARDLSDGAQVLKVMFFGSTLGEYELRVKRY